MVNLRDLRERGSMTAIEGQHTQLSCTRANRLMVFTYQGTACHITCQLEQVQYMEKKAHLSRRT